jgi:ligand-binding SRPBCC domain-containing protein
MRLHTLEQEQTLPISLEEAWDFLASPANLDAITPDDLGFRITCPLAGKMFAGQIISYRIRLAPLVHATWVTEIKCVEEGRAFVDEQRFGPYRFWHHRHEFEVVPGGVLMRDKVHYALPFGPIGSIAHALFVRRKLEGIFRFRRDLLVRRFAGRAVTLGANEVAGG